MSSARRLKINLTQPPFQPFNPQPDTNTPRDSSGERSGIGQLPLDVISPRSDSLEHGEIILGDDAAPPERPRRTGGARGRYLSYTEQQIESLFDLVNNKQVKTAEAARIVGVNPRTAQRMVKDYEKDLEKRLPTRRNQKRRGPQSTIRPEHSNFLIAYLEEHSDAVLVEAVTALKDQFPDINVSKTTVYNHLTNQCKLTLKRSHKEKSKSDVESILEIRKNWATEWQNREEDLRKRTVFVDVTEFKMKTIRTLEWSTRSQTHESSSSDQGTTITVAGAFFHGGLLGVSMYAPKAGESVKDHLIGFISNILDTMDQTGMRRYNIIMEQTLVHQAEVVIDRIGNRGHICAFFPPESSFLNPVGECWSKVRAKYHRAHLNDDSVADRIQAAAETISPSDMAAWIGQLILFIPLCISKELDL